VSSEESAYREVSNEREGMGLYQAMSSLRYVAHDGVLCTDHPQTVVRGVVRQEKKGTGSSRGRDI
jgi:hypothetical protein